MYHIVIRSDWENYLRIDQLQWDDSNTRDKPWHRMNMGEVEDICFGVHIAGKEPGGRYVLSGQAAGGSYLNVVIDRVGKGLFRPITAFEISERYKSRFAEVLKNGERN
jgi:hypothetical protein